MPLKHESYENHTKTSDPLAWLSYNVISLVWGAVFSFTRGYKDFIDSYIQKWTRTVIFFFLSVNFWHRNYWKTFSPCFLKVIPEKNYKLSKVKRHCLLLCANPMCPLAKKSELGKLNYCHFYFSISSESTYLYLCLLILLLIWSYLFIS